MSFNIFARAVAFLLSTIVLAACQTSQDTDNQTLAYNRAVADSTNEFFLINALRAQDRFPIYYSRTTGNSSAASLTPSTTLSLTDAKLTPSVTLGASGSNTISLANLDDQKFVRGVLSPVPLATLDSYYGQGWPKEELLMMFIKKIEIDQDLVKKLAARFDELCKPKNNADTLTAEELYCDDGRPHVLGETSDKRASRILLDTPSTIASGSVCTKTGKTAVYDNYPGNSGQLDCFQAMLRVLLKLGLQPAETSKFTVIIPAAPEGRIDDLRGVSEATTAKLVVSPRDPPKTNLYAVCSKSDAAGFTFTDDTLFKTGSEPAPTKSVNADAKAALALSVAEGLPALKQTAAAAYANAGNAGALRFVNNPTGLGQITTSIIGPTPSSCSAQADQFDLDTAQKIICKSAPETPGCKKAYPPTFNFTTRSLDSMIYYLGEILRADSDVKIWNFVKDGTPPDEQALFLVKHDGKERYSMISTEYRGENYYIPGGCSTGQVCQQDHRCLQILSLLNQLWGLQKEAADAPSIPVVSVIGH